MGDHHRRNLPNAKNWSLRDPKGKPLKSSMRRKKRTTRSPRMASLRRGKGWHHLHHLPHHLFQARHHHQRLLLLHPRQHHRLLLHQSKRFHWPLRHLQLRPKSQISWRTPQAPLRHTCQPEGPPLQTLQLQKMFQSGMRLLRKVATRTHYKPPWRLSKRQTFPLRSQGCGNL